MVVLAQVDDLVDSLLADSERAVMRSGGLVAKALLTERPISPLPLVVGLPGDAVTPTCHGDAVAVFVIAKDRQAPGNASIKLPLGHVGLLLLKMETPVSSRSVSFRPAPPPPAPSACNRG